MSGICGLFNLDKAPVAEADLRAMVSQLIRRGPERCNRWQDGPVGLGHTLLGTTPELLWERQPFTHAETGCVITADVRLDNRDELLGSLALEGRPAPVGDAELILTAYLRWGEGCVDRLLGDLAFAIWDPRAEKIFCVRDHFGLRPLYFHYAPGRLFAFASEPSAILVLSQVAYQLNPGRIADFLVPELEWVDYTSTFFEGVQRLPPGHKLTATPTRRSVTEYWRPHPPDVSPLTLSDEDYREGLLDVLSKAVRSRLRGPAGRVGAMLSGGMDSGSVAAVATGILGASGEEALHTFSVVSERDADCAESRAVRAAVNYLPVSPTLIPADNLDRRIPQLTSGHQEPFDGELALIQCVYLTARDAGRTVLLDGAGGDVVLGAGSYVLRLMRQGQLIRAWQEIVGENRFWDSSSVAVDLARNARAAFVPKFVKRSLRGAQVELRVRESLRDSLIAPEFADRVNIRGRFVQLRQTFSQDHARDLGCERCDAIRPNLTAGRERYARQSAAAGMEARDPFLDKRVVDYCAGLPGRVLIKDGWPKAILRQAMADRLPDEVRWARRKPHLGPAVRAAIVGQLDKNGMLHLSELRKALTGYVDQSALEARWNAYLVGGPSAPVYTAYLLATWLKENETRPEYPPTPS